MGKYPSGVSMKEMFKMEREELEMALMGKIQCGVTEEGIRYCPGDKEEIHAKIREIYRNAEYWALEMAASARAIERIAEEYGVNISADHLKEYMAYVMEEKAK